MFLSPQLKLRVCLCVCVREKVCVCLLVWVLGMLLWIVETKPECGSFSEKTMTMTTKAETAVECLLLLSVWLLLMLLF